MGITDSNMRHRDYHPSMTEMVLKRESLNESEVSTVTSAVELQKRIRKQSQTRHNFDWFY